MNHINNQTISNLPDGRQALKLFPPTPPPAHRPPHPFVKSALIRVIRIRVIRLNSCNSSVTADHLHILYSQLTKTEIMSHLLKQKPDEHPAQNRGPARASAWPIPANSPGKTLNPSIGTTDKCGTNCPNMIQRAHKITNNLHLYKLNS